MTPEQNSQDLTALKKQIQDLQNKLEKSTKVTNALIAGEREENLLYKWKAPTRLYFKRDKQWYWSMLLVFLIVMVVLLYMREWPLILAVASVMFVLYASSLVPPEEVEHQITTLGIRTLGELYTWDMFKYFWISYRGGREILNVDTNITSPTRLILLFSSADKQPIVEEMKKKLKYMDAPRKQGRIAKMSEGVFIPLTDVEATMVKRPV